jgi:hypothetical protein
MEEIKIINSKKEFLIKINYLSNTFFVINNDLTINEPNKSGKFEIIEDTMILIWENDDIEYYKKKCSNVYYSNNNLTEYYFINSNSNNLNNIYYIDDLSNIYDNKSSNNKIIGKQINDNECKINKNYYYLYENKFYEKLVYDKIISFEYILIFIDNNDNIINKNFIFNKLTNIFIENTENLNKLNGLYTIKNDLLNVKFDYTCDYTYENNFILTSDKILYSNELLNKYYQEITINYNNLLRTYILDKKNNNVFDKYDIDKKYLVIPSNDYYTIQIDFNNNNDDYIYFNYDNILDLYIIIEKNSEIFIIHNSWNDTLILNNYNNTLKRKSVESETGKFKYNNNKIIIYWDNWDQEVFIKNKDNNYNLLNDEKTEYIEIFHKNWNDKCIIKDNFITRISANNESGIIEHKNDNTIEIKWNNWDCEKFYIINNNYHHEKIIKIGIINDIKYYFNLLNNFIYNTQLNEIGNFNFIDLNKIFINLEHNKREYNYKEVDNNIIFIKESNITLVKYKLEETYIIYEDNVIDLEHNIFCKNDKNIYGKYKLYDNFIEIKWNYNKKELYKKNNIKYYLIIEKKYKLIDFNKIYYLNIDVTYFYDKYMKYDFLYNKNSYFIILNDVIKEFREYNFNELIYISKEFYEYIKKENYNKKLYNNLYYDVYFNNTNKLEQNISEQNISEKNISEKNISEQNNKDIELKILLHWYNNKEKNNIYSLNNFYKKYDFFDIINFKKKNSIKINDENTIISWIVKNRFSNLFYNNYDIDIIENNIIENNIVENNSSNNNNNKIFLVCIIKNKLDIDILSNIIFKKKNLVIFIIIQFENDILLKDLFLYIKNNIDNCINYFILKTKNNIHYFNIQVITKIINKYFIKYYNLINDDNISINSVESIIIDNSIFIYIKEMSSINEELCIHNIYLKNINIKISNIEENKILFKEFDNFFIKMLYIIDNNVDLIKLLIIYYLVVRKNINNLDNVFYLNYFYLLEIFNFYNENMILIK